MTPDPVLPPVDWTGLRPIAGGPRHYTGPEVGAKAAWKCPACGEENTGVLEQGCVHCGNGGGARHVGVDPRVERPKVVEVEDVSSPALAADTPPRTIVDAFTVWVTRARDLSPLAIFGAGWVAALQANEARMTRPVTDHPENVPTVAPVLETGQPVTVDGQPFEVGEAVGPQETFLGTAEDRTLLAALTLLQDTFYGSETEEVRTGEWINPTDLSTWISYVRARVEGAETHE